MILPLPRWSLPLFATTRAIGNAASESDVVARQGLWVIAVGIVSDQMEYLAFPENDVGLPAISMRWRKSLIEQRWQDFESDGSAAGFFATRSSRPSVAIVTDSIRMGHSANKGGLTRCCSASWRCVPATGAQPHLSFRADGAGGLRAIALQQ